ncbi:MAG: hypothetical protein JWR18_3859 [Segetibacter sp.]|nr:hypothetical protein [Segetibacter sp.]
MKAVFLLLLISSSTFALSQVNDSVHRNRPHPSLKKLDRTRVVVGKTNETPTSPNLRPINTTQSGIYLSSKQIKGLTAAGGLHYGHKALLYGDHLAMSKALSQKSLGMITEKKALLLLAAGKKMALKSPAKMFTLAVTAGGAYYFVKDWLGEDDEATTNVNPVSVQK